MTSATTCRARTLVNGVDKDLRLERQIVPRTEPRDLRGLYVRALPLIDAPSRMVLYVAAFPSCGYSKCAIS
jgi:hypothetical protein